MSAKNSPFRSIDSLMKPSPKGLKHEYIVITGTRKGIGKALAEHYLKRVAGKSRAAAEARASLTHTHYTHLP